MNGNVRQQIFISYGTSDNDLVMGSFDDIPNDAFMAKITLKIPIVTSSKDVSYKSFYHRIFCGKVFPADMYLESHFRDFTSTKLIEFKENSDMGMSSVVVPHDSSDINNFVFFTDKDTICSSRTEFISKIHGFKDDYSYNNDFVNYDESDKRSL